MVDSVFVTGIADGALDGVPAWATENTLYKIQSILERISATELKLLDCCKDGGGSGAGGSRTASDLDKALTQLVDDFDKLHKQNKKRKKDNEDFFQDNKKAKDITRLLTDKKAMLAYVTGLVVKSFNGIIAVMTDNTKVFDHLNRSGVMMMDSSMAAYNGFDSLRKMVGIVEIKIGDLAKTMDEHNGANTVGMVKFAKTIPMARKQLEQLGYNFRDSADVIGAYLDVMQNVTHVQSMNSAQIARGAIEFAENMTKLSYATGISRKQLMQQTTAISASTDAAVIASSMSDEAAQKAAAFAASFKDPAVGQTFLKMMSAKVPALNATFQNFAKTGMGPLGLQVMKLTKSLVGLDPAEAGLKVKNFVNSVGGLDAAIRRQQFLAEANVEGADDTLKQLVALKQAAIQYKDVDAKSMKAQQASAARLSRIQSAWDALMSKFSAIFSPSDSLLDVVGGGLEKLNIVVGKIIEGMDWMAGKINTTFGNLIFYTLAATTALMGLRSLGALASLVSRGVAAVMGAPTLISRMLGSLGSILSFVPRLMASVVSRIPGLLFTAGRFIITRIGAALLGPVGWIAGAMSAAYLLYESVLSNISGVINMFDTIFYGLDKLLQFIPGAVGRGAKERIAIADNYNASAIKEKKASSVAVLNTPAPSTLNMPAVVSPVINTQSAAPNTTQSDPNTTQTPQQGTSTNNTSTATMNSQLVVMQQMLETMKDVASVNKDMLRHIKVQ